MSNTYLPTNTFFDTGLGGRAVGYTEDGIETVSYTHLTLPTILLV